MHAAFMLAASAAALDRPVAVFATGEGLAGLARDAPDRADARLRAAGVAGVAELRDACRALGVRLLACDAALKAAGLPQEALAAGVEVAGMTTFLAAADGQLVSF